MNNNRKRYFHIDGGTQRTKYLRYLKLCRVPIDKRRRFNVDTTSYDIARGYIDVETTSCVYRGDNKNEIDKLMNDSDT